MKDEVLSLNTTAEKSFTFQADIFNPNIHNWSSIMSSIKNIEEAAFPDYEVQEQVLEKDFTHPENSVVLLKTQDGNIIGYSYAEPISHLDRRRTAKQGETAYITSTAIHPNYQQQRLVGIVLDKLETELVRKGYSFIERHASVENGYADAIERHYKERIVVKKDRKHSVTGAQRFFRIQLKKR